MIKNNKYLIKISASGNKFLVADYRWFDAKLMDFLPPYSCLIEQPFKNFEELSQKSQEERSFFLNKIFSLKEFKDSDGLIVFKDSKNLIPHYDFYNKDGSMPEMCGNASCCLIDYGRKTNLNFENFQLGQFSIKAMKNFQGDWSISLSKNSIVKSSLFFSYKGKEYPYSFVVSGVPHAVLEWESDFQKEDLKPLAQAMRYNKKFQEEGMNVSYYKIEKDNYLKGITFERGVEDFTLACGTGALSIATAFVRSSKGRHFKEVFIDMPGGQLIVDLRGDSPLLKSSVKWGY